MPAPAETASAEQLADLLTSHRYVYRDEVELHGALEGALVAAGHDVEREVALGPRCRIDLLVGAVGIEVKTAGAAATVARQLQRYAKAEQVRELLLVTSVARHLRMPETIGGKPLVVASLLQGGL